MLNFRVGTMAAVLCLLLSSASRAQDQTRSGQPQIVTSGQGEVRVLPDRATVSIGVETRALTAAEASTNNGRKQRAVIEAIRAKGVGSEQITTAGFDVQPEIRVDRPNMPPITTGYLVSNIVIVKLHRTDLVGVVIDASIGAGANRVHSLSFSISNPDSARRAALTIAVVRAKGDADAVARAAGGVLGTMLELSATDYDVPVIQGRSGTAFGSMGGVELASAVVEPGLQPVRATVTIRWQFIPGGR